MTDLVATSSNTPRLLDPEWLVGRGRLGLSIKLEEQDPSRVTAVTIGLIVSAIALFVVWASFTVISEIAPTTGEVAPVGSVKRVQHLEGGIVAAVHVREGDNVVAGDPLMDLDAGAVGPDLDQLKTRLAAFELQEKQLSAVAEGESDLLPLADLRLGDVRDAQAKLFSAKRDSQLTQIAVLERQIEQRKSERQSQVELLERVKEQVAAKEEQVRIRTASFKLGYTARTVLLENQRELSRALAQESEVRGQIARSGQAIEESLGRVAELRAKDRLDARAELGKLRSEMAELSDQINRADDRVRRLTVRAPVAGVVKGVQTETIGGVIAPGSTLMEIVPRDSALMVESRVLPKDVGYVHPGQSVNVKVNTYDYTRYGSIHGVIETVSATTFQDEKTGPYYRARIKLDKAFVGDDPARHRVISGMNVTADIQTGQKSVLAYLLKPIVRATSESLRER